MAAADNGTSSQPLKEETTAAKRLRFTTSSSNHQPLMLPGDVLHVPLNTLPSDPIPEILARLPVKSLLRFRCVCKSWNALISDARFAKKQFQTSGTDPSRRHLITPSKPPIPNLILKDYSVTSIFNSSSSVSSQRNSPYRNSLYYYSVGSCHGMICLIQPYIPLLWNPSTGKFKELPSPNLPHRSFLVCGFGYDCSGDVYKVVAIFVRSTNRLFVFETEVKVHTLGTDSWRPIEKFPADIPVGNSGNFVSERLNWLAWSDGMRSWAIVSLDLGTEIYQQILLPDCLVRHKSMMSMSELKGCLCILAGSDVTADVWVMNDYGNKESWTKLFSVPRMEEFPRALCICDGDDEILIQYGSVLATFCPKSRRLKIHGSWEFIGRNFAVVYAESLISPCF